MTNYISKEIPLWEDQDFPTVTAYLPTQKTQNCAIVILPGGAYCFRAEHEGKGYAEFFAAHGIVSFVVNYRCKEDKFPLPLLDARRAIQLVRYHAQTYHIDPCKIAIMGSSAGGHLAALTSVYDKPISSEHPDAMDSISFKPNAQILCYPVIKLLGKGITHFDSGRNLLGENHALLAEELSPDLIAASNAPQAFIWHTFEDSAVNVINSIDYTRRLKECGVSTELHIFPKGHHGLGLAEGEDDVSRYVSKWKDLLIDWLYMIDFCR